MKVKVILALAAAMLLVVSIVIGDEQEPIYYHCEAGVVIYPPQEQHEAYEYFDEGPQNCEVDAILGWWMGVSNLTYDNECASGYINEYLCYLQERESNITPTYYQKEQTFSGVDLRGNPYVKVRHTLYSQYDEYFFDRISYGITADGTWAESPDE